MYHFPEGFYLERFTQALEAEAASVQLRAVRKTFKNRERYTVPSYLLFIPLKGQKVFYNGEQSCSVEAGELLLIRAGARLSCDLTRLDDGLFEAIMFQMDPHFIADVLNKYRLPLPSLQASPQDLCRVDVSALLKSSIESLLPFFMHPSPQHEVLIRLKMEELVLHLLHLQGPEQADLVGLLAEALHSERGAYLKLIQDCLQSSMTIEEMARAMHQSPSKFKKEFKQLFQMPPAQYLQEKRLEEAQYMLLNTDQSITEIGLANGFESSSHFIQVFKKKYGLTPGQFKKSKSDI